MFGNYIRQLREECNIGSRELSKKINKAETYISQLERGLIKKPDYETSKLILYYLKLPENQIGEILLKFNILKTVSKQYINSIEPLSERMLTKDYFEEKCKEDALEIYNLINTLPDKTREILKSLMSVQKL